MVLGHLVKLGSLREISLSAYMGTDYDIRQGRDFSTQKAEVERNFREGFNSPIFLGVSFMVAKVARYCECEEKVCPL
jgi:hypothetical protein